MSADQPLPGLFAYKTAPEYGGMAALDWFDPDPDAAEMSAELWSGPIEPGWSHCATFMDDGGAACVLKVDASSRTIGTSRVRRDGSGLDALGAQSLENGLETWSLLAALQTATEQSRTIFAYDGTGGTCRELTVLGDASPTVSLGDARRVSAGWTQLNVVELAEEMCLLGYNTSDGGAALVSPDASMATVWKENWQPGWSLMSVLSAPFEGVFLYKSEDGSWQLNDLNTESAIHRSAGAWRPGWDVLLPFTLNGSPHVLGYENQSGDVEILKLDDAGQGEVVWTFRWSAGWSIQLPLHWR